MVEALDIRVLPSHYRHDNKQNVDLWNHRFSRLNSGGHMVYSFIWNTQNAWSKGKGFNEDLFDFLLIDQKKASSAYF